MSRDRSGFWAAICVGSFAMLTGCNSGGPRTVDLHGTITLDGQPVVAGSVFFTPDTTNPNPGRTTSTRVTDGKYDMRPAGVVVGAATVQLNVLELGSFQPKDWDNLTDAENRRLEITPTRTYTKSMTIDAEELNLAFVAGDLVQPGTP